MYSQGLHLQPAEKTTKVMHVIINAYHGSSSADLLYHSVCVCVCKLIPTIPYIMYGASQSSGFTKYYPVIVTLPSSINAILIYLLFCAIQ